ncbi:Swt1 family HEPN domain-containing protein [Devosia sp. 2618]|uniref:Swt1 family HEPN domain-containing protein n=1 Tax=Devosia sp. 2618 TaxID=3156454 RepID=UPI003394D70C
MSNSGKELRDFVFRGLLFESESEVFRQAGIKVGIDLGQTEESLLVEALSPFGVQRRNQAMEMARLYAVLHAFENEVRSLIRDTLTEKVGADWWESTASVPNKVRTNADARKKVAEADSWLEGSKGDQLEFADFGDLALIILQSWEHFKDLGPGQDWIKQRMNELEKARNFVAHNRMLLPSEFQRIYMYVSDWNKVIGL